MRRPGGFYRPTLCLRTHLTKRYGARFLPADMTIQDWGVTYEELEPHYDRFEYLCGTSGTAGNLQGQIQPGGNPFEGSRSRPYPNPAQEQPFSHALFAEGAKKLGYKPFPQPSGNMSQAYVNPLGRALGPLHLLRLLRMVRLRQLFQSEPPDDDFAGARAQSPIFSFAMSAR